MAIVTAQRLVTIERHIAEQEHLHPHATGEFSRLLRDLMLAFRLIAREVSRAGLNDILGLTGTTNVYGEAVRKLDAYAHEVIVRAMEHGGHLCAMASEESDGLIALPPTRPRGKYILLFDPLDGSTNIDVNVTIGTIFSIYRRRDPALTTDATLEDVLRPGCEQVAAGYVCYGSSVTLVYSTGNGVDVFTYDPTLGEFFLTIEKLRIPRRGTHYSINEGNAKRWAPELQDYIDYLKTPSHDQHRPYSLRYVGSAVADVHRVLHYGGIFMYPADRANPSGKLRLMFEVNPLAFVTEQAGGRASNGCCRILDIRPESLRQRVPVFLGSPEDVAEAEAFLQGRHILQRLRTPEA
ncbi:MAG: class 1 fructose-bisphosphatase [Candidatus Kapabacteria bacterium]|nr:class 1 fructose-bisphosphatase [Candidatus Kapabacteria bacterium]MCS7169879.1 class 1 fructose-bisphosphatase [Candidatus Kapabacteria bacterium]MDW7997215.1 class 1 fructose-bisphosphatase [Bacteroidota bacterium]MDW8225725.1 class 1 fructose-bisphosphatase [Bacteroidota bacterium]